MEKNSLDTKMKEHKTILIWIIKIACIAAIAFVGINTLTLRGVSNFYGYKDYSYQTGLDGSIDHAAGANEITQQFKSKGNQLPEIKLFFGAISDHLLRIIIKDERGSVILEKTIDLKGYNSDSWNTIDLDCNGLKRNGSYYIALSGEGMSAVTLSTSNADKRIFGKCTVDGQDVPSVLAVGLQMSERYLSLGNGFVFLMDILFTFAMILLLCIAVARFECLYQDFKGAEHKHAIPYALYFSIFTTLLFNPIDNLRMKVTTFKRIIGAGIAANVDVSKRISNFNTWFVIFAVTFSLFYLLVRYFRNKNYSEESGKALDFLDNLVWIANLVQLFMCISYFYDKSQKADVYYYTSYILMAIVLAAIAFISFDLGKKISFDIFERLMISVLAFSIPVSLVLINSPIGGIQEWDRGKILMGVQLTAIILVVASAFFLKISWSNEKLDTVVSAATIGISFIPLCTSLFIELVNVLNQHKVFLISVRRDYFRAMLVGIILVCIFIVLCCKHKIHFQGWKRVVYPVIILGVVCLWVQPDISAEYSADLFETANSSILISDFLKFGDIPIIQHYGGHMMTGVWEGIVYGLINKDFVGAALSPYAGYISTLIALCFYSLLSRLWNKDAAFLTTLFFPFYNSLGNWGLGILLCLALMNFIRENSYFRAVVFWLSAVWITLYRLDLGFAFLAAGIIASVLYIIQNKNLKALRLMLLAMISVGAVIGGFWFAVCVYRNVDPISRLKEFLLISASNLNWANTGIGDSGLSMFSWTYLFIPFLVVVCMLYVVFSAKFKESISKECWVLLLVLGFSFIYNYSRGLVRHTLVESQLTLIMWTAYIFFAVLAMSVKNNPKLFLPVLSAFILCNTLFLTDNNFNERSLADNSVSKMGTFVDTWHTDRFAEQGSCTIWAKYNKNQEVIKRVKYSSSLNAAVRGYNVVVNGLLDDSETFVDFINKTFVYSSMGREDPVYVSQSPLQISGEFTQEQFVKEIEGVPIVLMPRDANNIGSSEALDGIPNSVRYYKIAEYIYRHYVPLCTYEDKFAVWCLPERYNNLAKKVKALSRSGNDIKEGLLDASKISAKNVKVIGNADGSVNINSTGDDPAIYNIQNLFELSNYVNKNDTDLKIAVNYETDTEGTMQLYYTTNNGESYTTDKVVSDELKGKGTAWFTIPGATVYTHIRMNIPEGSNVRITSLRMDAVNCKLVDYGYDGPFPNDDGSYDYLPFVHSYSVDQLPLIWAEKDEEHSANNTVLAKAVLDNGNYLIDKNIVNDDKGAYLKVTINYPGYDRDGKYKEDDEYTSAAIRAGEDNGEDITTKCLYNFTVQEGLHEYLFRISSDYYWYLKEINTFTIESSESFNNVSMEVLEGD